VQLTADGHYSKPPWLSNLGLSLFDRFERLGDLADLNASILNFKDTLRLTPDGHPDKHLYFTNHGIALRTHFIRLGDHIDINNSITSFQNAVQLTADTHHLKPAWLNNLGLSLLTRFNWFGDLADLNESELNLRNAVRLTPDNHAHMATWFNHLGSLLLKRFRQLQNLDDVHEALSRCSVAASSSSASPSVRFDASRRWALCHHILQSPPSASLEAYHIAIDLLPQLAWLGSSMPDRHHQLKYASDTVCHAAAAAVKAGHNGLAVEWLEQGRSVIWGQLLQLRTPLDFLKSRHPELGQNLEHTLLHLEELESQWSITNMAIKPLGTQMLASKSGILAKSSHDLAYDRAQLLTKIRAQPGFETFMLPKPLSQLTPAACSGPIVMLVLSPVDNRCNALIILPNLEDDVISLALESFTPWLAEQLYAALQQIIAPNDVRDTYKENNGSQVSNTSVTKSTEDEFEDINILERLARSIHNNSLKSDTERLGVELVPIGKTGAITEHFTFGEILAELWNHVAKTCA
jgi:hypothetical protein